MRIPRLALLGLSLIACRGGDGNGDDTPPGVDAPPVGGSVTIQQVQDPAMPEGTAVELDGVVVTAIDKFGARTGDIWVQEPDGGEFSGIKVFGAPLDQIATLAVGDIVTISNAQKEEFACSVAICGADFRDGLSITEIEGLAGGALSVVKTGTGALPAPEVVDALAIEMLPQAARDAEWEKWEGVLITATKIRQSGDVVGFGDMAPDQFNFRATGNVSVQSALADLGTNAVAGTCYTGITGIGDFFFEYLIFPTATEGLVPGGTDCAAQQVTTIAAIQDGTATGEVILNDVFVVARSFNNKSLWVSQSLTAAPNEGIFVFRGGAVLPDDIAVGAKVNVTGTTKEQNDPTPGETLTQVLGSAVTLVAAPAAPIVPVATEQASSLTEAATGEPFESVLVTLTNVKVTAVGDQANFGVGQLQQGGITFLSDDDAFRLPATELNKCYASITGIWTFQVFDNAYGLLPLAVGTGTGVCQ
jgi:hypothetical protein